jgi:hypothetical protein
MGRIAPMSLRQATIAEASMLWSLSALWQSCEGFGRTFGGCFSRVLEREAAHVDYAALRSRCGTGVTRALTTPAMVAIYKAARLALRHEMRRTAALRRLATSGRQPSCSPTRSYLQKEKPGQPER